MHGSLFIDTNLEENAYGNNVEQAPEQSAYMMTQRTFKEQENPFLRKQLTGDKNFIINMSMMTQDYMQSMANEGNENTHNYENVGSYMDCDDPKIK